MKCLLLILTALFGINTGAVLAETFRPVKLAALDEAVEQALREGKIIGVESAAMLYVARRLMAVDDLVTKHLPEFTGDGREKVTIRHLLLHSSASR